MTPDETKKLESLKADLKKARNAIDKIEVAEMRRVNSVLVGLCFKQAEKRGDRYPQYACVIRMDEDGMLYYNSFQRDKTGNTHIYVDHCGYHMQYWKRITSLEYQQAARRIVQHVRLQTS